MNAKKSINIIIPLMICLFVVVQCVNNQLKENNVEKTFSEYSNDMKTYEPIQEAFFIAPISWDKYNISNSFSISLPKTLEMRGESDLYTKRIKDIFGYIINSKNVVFQQTGLSVYDSEAMNTYCRFILNVEIGKSGDYMKCNEWTELSIGDIETFQKLANYSVGEYEIIGEINVCWIHFGEIYGIKVNYVRTGHEGNRTNVNTYYFFNNDRMATLTFSYRLSDADKWRDDFEKIVRSFSWM